VAVRQLATCAALALAMLASSVPAGYPAQAQRLHSEIDYSGGGLYVTYSLRLTGFYVAGPSDALVVRFIVSNLSGRPITLTFPSSSEAEIRITHGSQVVRRFSIHGDAAGPHSITYRHAEGATYSATWPQDDEAGNPIPPGAYLIAATLRTSQPPAQTVYLSVAHGHCITWIKGGNGTQPFSPYGEATGRVAKIGPNFVELSSGGTRTAYPVEAGWTPEVCHGSRRGGLDTLSQGEDVFMMTDGLSPRIIDVR
jgi:hypothetical protein